MRSCWQQNGVLGPTLNWPSKRCCTVQGLKFEHWIQNVIRLKIFTWLFDNPRSFCSPAIRALPTLFLSSDERKSITMTTGRTRVSSFRNAVRCTLLACICEASSFTLLTVNGPSNVFSLFRYWSSSERPMLVKETGMQVSRYTWCILIDPGPVVRRVPPCVCVSWTDIGRFKLDFITSTENSMGTIRRISIIRSFTWCHRCLSGDISFKREW